MKLLIIGLGILFFISGLSHAAFIIEPNKNDRSYSLKKTDKNSLLTSKRNLHKKNHCKYQLNDYRTEKGSEIGCAINKNAIHSKYNNF